MTTEAVPRGALLARNSVANLIRVASTSLVSLFLPLVLVVVLEPRYYATWALLFGVAGFVLYLDFGLPTSVQTLVARADTAGTPAASRRAALSGVRWALCIGLVLLLAVGAVGVGAGSLFPGLRTTSSVDLTLTVLFLAVGNVSTLVGNTASAYFAAVQRSGVAALFLVPGRIASLVISVLVAVLTQNLVLVAAGYALPLVLGAVAIVVKMRRATTASAPGPERGAGEGRFQVLRYSGPLTAWSLYMLCISGAGIVIVGRVDYRSVAIFSLATAFSAALTGVQSAVIAPVLSELGRSYAVGDGPRSTRIVALASASNGAVVAIGVVGIQALYLVFQPLLGGVTSTSAAVASVIVGLTVLAGGIRLTMSPLTFAFIGSGSHGRLLLPPMCEALITLAATIAFGSALGAVGVSIGLTVGALSGVLLALLWSHRVTRVVALTGRRIAMLSAVTPFLAVLIPECLFFVVGTTVTVEAVRVGGSVVMVLAGGIALWVWSVPQQSRAMATGLLLRAGRRTVGGS